MLMVAFLAAASARAETPPLTSGDLPRCLKAHGYKLIGAKFGLHFSVPKSGFDITGGKWDVDYVKYIIRPRASSALVVVWLGGNTLPLDPDPETLKSSTRIERRSFTAPGNLHGKDSRGLSKRGYWRHFALDYSGGAVYETAAQEALPLLDSIINSACYIPHAPDN